MPSTRANTPQLAVPFRVTAGRESVVEQGSVEEFVQHAKVAARVEVGHLDADPTFGTSDQTFTMGGVDTGRLASELRNCDPRQTFDVEQALQGASAIVQARVRGANQ